MEKTFICFSAKDLCTRSCMQIKLFRDRPELKPTPNANQWEGVNFQHELAATIPNIIGEEMGNYIEVDNIRIFFSNDIVCNDKIIEVKNIDKNRVLEDWYFNSCILQSAIYKTLTYFCNNKLRTSTFHVNNGNPFLECQLKENTPFILYMGNDKYEINVLNYDIFKRYLIKKAQHSLNWDDAKMFDMKYKGKEFELLKTYFTFNKIN